jgi:hypothetical protein
VHLYQTLLGGMMLDRDKVETIVTIMPPIIGQTLSHNQAERQDYNTHHYPVVL